MCVCVQSSRMVIILTLSLMCPCMYKLQRWETLQVTDCDLMPECPLSTTVPLSAWLFIYRHKSQGQLSKPCKQRAHEEVCIK